MWDRVMIYLNICTFNQAVTVCYVLLRQKSVPYMIKSKFEICTCTIAHRVLMYTINHNSLKYAADFYRFHLLLRQQLGIGEDQHSCEVYW